MGSALCLAGVCTVAWICVNMGLRWFHKAGYESGTHLSAGGLQAECPGVLCQLCHISSSLGWGVEELLPAKARARGLVRCLGTGSVRPGPASAWTWHCGWKLAWHGVVWGDKAAATPRAADAETRGQAGPAPIWAGCWPQPVWAALSILMAQPPLKQADELLPPSDSGLPGHVSPQRATALLVHLNSPSNSLNLPHPTLPRFFSLPRNKLNGRY